MDRYKTGFQNLKRKKQEAEAARGPNVASPTARTQDFGLVPELTTNPSIIVASPPRLHYAGHGDVEQPR
jgi:hypothetical protein